MLCWSEPKVFLLLLVTQSVICAVKKGLPVDTSEVSEKKGSHVDSVVNAIHKNGIFESNRRPDTSAKYQKGEILKVISNNYIIEGHNGNTIANSALLSSSPTSSQINTIVDNKPNNIKDDKKQKNRRYYTKHKKEGLLRNVCTERAVKEEILFPHPSDRNKYIICSAVKTYSIKNCPKGKYFSEYQQKCTLLNCEIPLWVNKKENVALNKSYPNPCKIDAKRICDLIYLPYPYDLTKFIQCDKIGHAMLKSCPIDWIWNNEINACFYKQKKHTPMQTCPTPLWDNPNEKGMPLPSYYVNPCKVDGNRNCDYIYLEYLLDKNKYIRCNRLGQAIVKTCPANSEWNPNLNECISLIPITTPKPSCPLPKWDDEKEVGIPLPKFYRNPCIADPTRTCKFIYLEYLIDNHKFIRCDRLGKTLIKTCPSSSNWNNDLKKCVSIIITTPKPPCPLPVWDEEKEVGIPLPGFYLNPCIANSTRTCDFVYMEYLIDNHKFIKCDRMGKALIKTCPSSSNWNNDLKECVSIIITTPKPPCPVPRWDNEKEVGISLPDFYLNPCIADSTRSCDFIYLEYIIDNHKFIRCDRLGKALIKTCPSSSNWNNDLKKCLSIITTPKPYCPIPVWDDEKEVGMSLPNYYKNPCIADPTRTCKFIYLEYFMDNNNFIRCDRLGHALIKTCPLSSKWNNNLKECVPIIITTPKLPCLVPKWDDEQEVGIPLPNFYRNPCIADSTRSCDFIYLEYIIDNHKFIRCDRLGKALIKTCPSSSNWNNDFKKCVSIITTPKPYCPIPVWDDEKEVGMSLPNYYKNPCIADSTRSCDFVYIQYLIDNHKFIRCDRLGKALIKTCPLSSKWNIDLKKCENSVMTPSSIITTPKPQCLIPEWDNPKEPGTKLPDYYPNPCNADLVKTCKNIYVKYIIDNHKYIKCDIFGQAVIKSCPFSSNWNIALNICETSPEIKTTPPVITTPKLQCPIPVWDNLKEVGTELPNYYPNPCSANQERKCDFIYLVYIIDNHKFIRCDRLGKALIKTCPLSSIWNNDLKKCENLVVTTPSAVISTPISLCPRPAWDNPQEVGVALPDYYPNPCTSDSIRDCEFLYLEFFIDNHKFITCDRLGQALVKTCPSSSSWNNELKKCD